MKWFFLLLLLLNLAYLGWEVDRESKQFRINQSSAFNIPATAKQLQLISELEQKPDNRKLSNTSQTEVESTAKFVDIPLEFNPNRQSMMKLLLDQDDMMQLDDDLPVNTPGDTSKTLNTVPEYVCYSYGPIPNEQESDLMTNWFSLRDISYLKRQTPESGKQKFWIYLKPYDSTAKAQATLADLRQQGINDLHVIRNGDLLNAVSLGLFSSQAAVNRRLSEIQATGYQPLVVPYSAGKQIYWIDVKIDRLSEYTDELFSDIPARFKAVPIKCDEIAIAEGNP
ncbi:MAG: SPOR domain-containing protein [Pseudomonadota bacterium]